MKVRLPFNAVSPLQEIWQPWFAWHPVLVETSPGALIVWFETIERKEALGYGGRVWRYREMKP